MTKNLKSTQVEVEKRLEMKTDKTVKTQLPWICFFIYRMGVIIVKSWIRCKMSPAQIQRGEFLMRNRSFSCVCVDTQLHQLYPNVCSSMDCRLSGSSVSGILQARIREWVVIPLQGIFPTQGSNLCLPHLRHCRQILYTHWATWETL